MVLVHAQAALVYKIGCAHENIVDKFVHIKDRSVIYAIPLSDFPAILIIGTLACDRVPVSLSIFCCSTGEATEIKPDRFSRARLNNRLPSGRLTLFFLEMLRQQGRLLRTCGHLGK